MSHEHPVEQLHRLAKSRANGELICVNATVEVHVFLQAGRVAWATDSKHPFSFASHLQESARIDVETFRQLVEECRRNKLPLGETLVEWGLASWEAVRNSLGHQIGQAITLMADFPSARTLFLERAYAEYNERLTFDIDDFLAKSATPTPAAAQYVTQPRTAPSQRPSLANQLRVAIEGLSWVEVHDRDRVVDAEPATPKSRIPRALQQSTLEDGADFVAIRSAGGSVVGLSLTPVRSLWCRLEADSTFGAIVSALWSMTATSERINAGPPIHRDAVAWSRGEGSARRNGEIVTFMHRAHEVLGTLVLSAAPTRELVFACGSRELELEPCFELARRRAVSLTRRVLESSPDCDQQLNSIGFYLRTMVTGETNLWCFGAELGSQAAETLWLLTDRRSSQGMGWAYLAALTRALSRVSDGEVA